MLRKIVFFVIVILALVWGLFVIKYDLGRIYKTRTKDVPKIAPDYNTRNKTLYDKTTHFPPTDHIQTIEAGGGTFSKLFNIDILPGWEATRIQGHYSSDTDPWDTDTLTITYSANKDYALIFEAAPRSGYECIYDKNLYDDYMSGRIKMDHPVGYYYSVKDLVDKDGMLYRRGIEDRPVLECRLDLCASKEGYAYSVYTPYGNIYYSIPCSVYNDLSYKERETADIINIIKRLDPNILNQMDQMVESIRMKSTQK